jgi:hypothetical protein
MCLKFHSSIELLKKSAEDELNHLTRQMMAMN